VEGADILYHCAGEIHDSARMEAVHVQGTERLIAAARGRIGKWVQLSSVGAYGSLKSGPITEDSPEAPEGEYESTKVVADHLVQAVAREGAFYVTILRPSNIYGPTMRNRSLFQLIGAIDHGLFVFIGHPGAIANYIHVDNVVEALVCCGTVPQANSKTYIVSDDCSMETLVAGIATCLGRPVPQLRIPAVLAYLAVSAVGWIPGFPLTENRVRALTNRTGYSSRRIEEDLSYKALISIEEGMQQMVQALQVGHDKDR
jgi:nucleoside-diphosphate-sugar epimerase